MLATRLVSPAFRLKIAATQPYWVSTVEKVLRAIHPAWGLESPLVFRDGAIYTAMRGFGGGELFKLERQIDGAWAKTILHSFGPNVVPAGNFVIDEHGTIFGVTYPVSVNGYAYKSWAYSLTPQ